MPRDGSGVYSLPAGNPVVTNTIIESAWANTTLGDIAAQLNNVYTRDGLLGPTGPFKLQDGTVNAPGLAWNSEPGLGWFRQSANTIGLATAGQLVAYMNAGVADTSHILFPRSTGGSTFFEARNTPSPGSVVDYNWVRLAQNADGSARLATGAGGTATRGNLTLDAPTIAATGAFTLQIPGSPYRSLLTQYVADGRLVIARDDQNWNAGTLQLYYDHADITVQSNAGPSVLGWQPNGVGLFLQGMAQTAGGDGAVQARWEGNGHSLRVVTSARRFKKDFEALPEGAMALVRKLKPLTYVSSIEGDSANRIPGFVAEDFDESGLKEYVVYRDGEVQSLLYDRVPVLLTKALQELDERITQLENA